MVKIHHPIKTQSPLLYPITNLIPPTKRTPLLSSVDPHTNPRKIFSNSKHTPLKIIIVCITYVGIVEWTCFVNVILLVSDNDLALHHEISWRILWIKYRYVHWIPFYTKGSPLNNYLDYQHYWSPTCYSS